MSKQSQNETNDQKLSTPSEKHKIKVFQKNLESLTCHNISDCKRSVAADAW